MKTVIKSEMNHLSAQEPPKQQPDEVMRISRKIGRKRQTCPHSLDSQRDILPCLAMGGGSSFHESLLGLESLRPPLESIG